MYDVFLGYQISKCLSKFWGDGTKLFFGQLPQLGPFYFFLLHHLLYNNLFIEVLYGWDLVLDNKMTGRSVQIAVEPLYLRHPHKK